MSRSRSIVDMRRRRVVWMVLCLFALRALVPIGFMVSLQASHAAVTLCPGFGPALPAVAALHAHRHAVHHSHRADSADSDLPSGLEGHDSHGLCPFAGAGHAGWQACGPLAAAYAPDLQRGLRPDAPAAAPARSLFRSSHSPRGPPALTPD